MQSRSCINHDVACTALKGYSRGPVHQHAHVQTLKQNTQGLRSHREELRVRLWLRRKSSGLPTPRSVVRSPAPECNLLISPNGIEDWMCVNVSSLSLSNCLHVKALGGVNAFQWPKILAQVYYNKAHEPEYHTKHCCLFQTSHSH